MQIIIIFILELILHSFSIGKDKHLFIMSH